VRLVGVYRAAEPEKRNKNGETGRSLGRGNCYHKNGKDLPVRRLKFIREGNQIYIDGIEHKLDRHKDYNKISPNKKPEHPDTE
jgi:hypothetical protein